MEPSKESHLNASLQHDAPTIITGEEDEAVLYVQRAQLLHFYDSEWHKRGLGELKILKHNDNGKLRVVMRHEDIQDTVCLNHMLNKDVVYKVKESKSWYFVANDYSEGQYEIMQLCLRFKTPDIASAFKKAVDEALSGAAVHEHLTHSAEFRGLSDEEKHKIVTLKLALDFFEYKKRPSCAGCRGCDAEAFCFAANEAAATVAQDADPIPLVFRAMTLASDAANGNVDLKLPDDFYANSGANCAGCRGCEPDSFVFPPTAVLGNVSPLPLVFKS